MDHAGIGTSPGPPPHGPLSSRPAEALPGAQVGDAYLGTGHADLRPRIDVDTAVGLSGDGAAHGVGDTHSQGPAVLTVAQRQQGVCGLTCHMGPPFQPRGHRSMALSARASPPPRPNSRTLTLTQQSGPRHSWHVLRKENPYWTIFPVDSWIQDLATLYAASTFSSITVSLNSHGSPTGATIPSPLADEVLRDRGNRCLASSGPRDCGGQTGANPGMPCSQRPC